MALFMPFCVPFLPVPFLPPPGFLGRMGLLSVGYSHVFTKERPFVSGGVPLKYSRGPLLQALLKMTGLVDQCGTHNELQKNTLLQHFWEHSCSESDALTSNFFSISSLNSPFYSHIVFLNLRLLS
jgi:hypothetical protein